MHLCTMSFDLGVWHATRALNAEAADAVYQALCEGATLPEDGSIATSLRVAAFMAELGSRFPDLDSLPDDDVAASPWASGFENSDQYAIFNIRWSAAKTMLPAIRALAMKHELVLYDPQDESVYNPPSLQSIPAWQFWRR